MTISRRNLIRWSTGVSLAAVSKTWSPLLASSAKPHMTTIPSTGGQLPSVGIGTVDFRTVLGSDEYQRFADVLRVFHNGGGRVVDTSPNYGNSEVVVGKLMEDTGLRDELFIATKVDREDQAAGVSRMEESFRQLGVDRIDLMQVHNLRGVDIQLETMKAWKEEGRLRYIGITTHTFLQYKEFEETMRAHYLDFIQVNYSVADRGAEERILPLAMDRGVAVLVNRPFGDGNLFRTVGDRPLPDWSAEIDCESWGQMFLKYVISHPAATIPIPGTTKPHHASDNVGALYGRLPDMALRREMEKYIDALM